MIGGGLGAEQLGENGPKIVSPHLVSLRARVQLVDVRKRLKSDVDLLL
jgi:hypothetical protein